MGLKKGQFSVFDIGFMLLLISSLFLIVDFSANHYTQINEDYFQEKYLFFLVGEDNFRNLVLSEDLSLSEVQNDWSFVDNFLNLNSSKYLYLEISNLSVSKKIFSCNPYKELYLSNIFIVNQTTDEFRKMSFGVCK